MPTMTVDALYQLLDAIASPPAADPDPALVASTNADAVNAFLALPPELSVAELVSTETFAEGADLDAIDS